MIGKLPIQPNNKTTKKNKIIIIENIGRYNADLIWFLY